MQLKMHPKIKTLWWVIREDNTQIISVYFKTLLIGDICRIFDKQQYYILWPLELANQEYSTAEQAIKALIAYWKKEFSKVKIKEI